MIALIFLPHVKRRLSSRTAGDRGLRAGTRRFQPFSGLANFNGTEHFLFFAFPCPPSPHPPSQHVAHTPEPLCGALRPGRWLPIVL